MTTSSGMPPSVRKGAGTELGDCGGSASSSDHGSGFALVQLVTAVPDPANLAVMDAGVPGCDVARRFRRSRA